MHVSGDGNFPNDGAVGVEFLDLVLTLPAYEIVPRPRLTNAPELIVQAHAGRRPDEPYLLCNLALAIHLDDPAGAVFDKQHASVAEWLAGMDLRIGADLVLPGDDASGRHLEGAPRMAEEKIPIRQRPAILGMIARVPPDDRAGGRHCANLVTV